MSYANDAFILRHENALKINMEKFQVHAERRKNCVCTMMMLSKDPVLLKKVLVMLSGNCSHERLR